jgi:hypothetical protein
MVTGKIKIIPSVKLRTAYLGLVLCVYVIWQDLKIVHTNLTLMTKSWKYCCKIKFVVQTDLILQQ